MPVLYRCARCGRRYPSRLEITEIRHPDGSFEPVCRQCLKTSRCELCGMVSDDRRKFGIRKVEGKWSVLCVKCIAAQSRPALPGRPGRGRKGS